MVRLRPPKTAFRPPNTIINVWFTRRRAGAAETVISGELHLQVRQSAGNVIIYPMDVRVDGAQYKYVRQFSNGTRVYETNWTTARLGSESCDISFMVLMPLLTIFALHCPSKRFSDS